MVREKGVPTGYKKTEVGVIPEDWEVKKLGDILDNTKLGGNYPNSELETEYPLIKMGNVGRGLIDTSKIEYVSEGYIPSNKDKLQYGDVLFNTRNTLELVGKVAIWRNELSSAYYNSNLLRLEFKSCYVRSTLFMNYMLNTKHSLAQLKGFAKGTTSVAAIYTRDLHEVKTPLPPLPEQKAIAKVLSDVDRLIASIERLIDKKQNIKEGIMQLLLTGKKRLPGFTGEWEVKTLGEIADVRKGQLITERNAIAGSIPVIGGGKQPSYFHNKANRTGRTITISASGAYAGYVSFYATPIFASDCSTIGSSDVYSIELIYFYLHYKQELIYNMQTGGAQPHIYPRDVQSIVINLPPLPEQKAIAQILSDMDAEIEALEKKLQKYKLVKEGMMEKLLTGKVRLV